MPEVENKMEETPSENTNNTSIHTDQQGRRKRPLVFVSEGVSDIATQKQKEEAQQQRYENERQRRNRKSLQDQLRANAAKKQRDFKKQVKKKERFNRLNKQELDYFQKLKKEDEKKEMELSNLLNDKISDFEAKKRILQRGNNTDTSDNNDDKHGTAISGAKSKSARMGQSSPMSIGVVRKKHKKLGISLKKLDSK